MADHNFKVGQRLLFTPRGLGHKGGAQACEVVRLMPIENGECQYRIRCTGDNVERMVRERQLSRQS